MRRISPHSAASVALAAFRRIRIMQLRARVACGSAADAAGAAPAASGSVADAAGAADSATAAMDAAATPGGAAPAAGAAAAAGAVGTQQWPRRGEGPEGPAEGRVRCRGVARRFCPFPPTSYSWASTKSPDMSCASVHPLRHKHLPFSSGRQRQRRRPMSARNGGRRRLRRSSMRTTSVRECPPKLTNHRCPCPRE